MTEWICIVYYIFRLFRSLEPNTIFPYNIDFSGFCHQSLVTPESYWNIKAWNQSKSIFGRQCFIPYLFVHASFSYLFFMFSKLSYLISSKYCTQLVLFLLKSHKISTFAWVCMNVAHCMFPLCSTIWLK